MNRETPFLLKQIERLAYLFLLFSLALGRLVALFFTAFPFLLIRKKPKKDFLFFPYTHKDNTGVITRFQIFLPLFDKDYFTYDIHYPCNMEYHDKIYFKSKSRAQEYFFLARLFWKRLFQTMKAGNYRAVFFQRGMFPLYYDQFYPYLEKLICLLNKNVIVDYFDADYGHNKKLIDSIAKTTNKVSVVNDYLFSYFKLLNRNVYLNDLSLDLAAYTKKTDFSNYEKLNLFWTGNPINAENLIYIIPILEKINIKSPLKLSMVCRTSAGYNSPILNHKIWEPNTFFELLNSADIALYPIIKDDEFNKGKVAYKSLEYGASALPIIASNIGLSPHFVAEEDVLIANTPEEWEKQIIRLINDEELRKKLGTNARIKTEKFHSVESTYKNFLAILLSENLAPLKNKGSI